ncbi:MAG: Unknown protein [uncultured Aureispira sp.]|uniref:Uncharacterized protein n=1 Tax=uncultured Aureispira sp. TaxID=1331704 RepID=A0A6S6TCQ5_9BACT|nr:MAG: Unknown protein [uncultured Aureispira sp.]
MSIFGWLPFMREILRLKAKINLSVTTQLNKRTPTKNASYETE